MISLHAVMFLTSLRLESRIENAVCLQQAFRTLCRLNLSYYFQAAEGNRHVNSQIIFITATETGFYLTWVECHATYDGSHKKSHMKNEHEREQLILRGNMAFPKQLGLFIVLVATRSLAQDLGK